MNRFWRSLRRPGVASFSASCWFRTVRGAGIGAGVLALFLWLSPSLQSALMIQRIEVRSDGLLELDFSGDPASYYRLLSGAEVNRIDVVVDLSLEPPLLAIPEGGPARFYRVQQIPRAASLDTDGDQIPDVYELLHPLLDPLNPAWIWKAAALAE